MAPVRLQSDGSMYHRKRVLCVTILPSYRQEEYAIDPAVESSVIRLVETLGPHCRVSKFQWFVETAEPCGAVTQDLSHEGIENVLVFSALVRTDWKFYCRPQGEKDEWEFDGIAAFLQRLT